MQINQTRRSAWARIGATVVVAGCLTACASSPRLSAQWTDPGLGSQSGLLRGAKVLVACGTFDVAVRQVCQQQLEADLVARGSTAVSIPSESPTQTEQSIDAQLLSSARAAQTRALLVVTLEPAATDVSPGFSLGVGGFGFGRSGAAGVGVTAPIGGGTVRTGFAANGRVIDVATGKLVWTASAVAPPASDLNAEVRALSKTVLDAAQKAGLF